MNLLYLQVFLVGEREKPSVSIISSLKILTNKVDIYNERKKLLLQEKIVGASQELQDNADQ